MKFVALSLNLFIAVTNLHAWSGPGHMTVAAIAYRELKPEEQQKITKVLSTHPDFQKWQEAAGKEAAGLAAMMGASAWPDAIKRKHDPWDHPKWHYINYPIIAPDFAKTPGPSPDNDIVFAIGRCVEKIKDATISLEDKACWLAWLIHLVGDVHQPLLCCALVNQDFSAPFGDHGGNSLFVKASINGRGIKLHEMWDEAAGSSAGFHEKQLLKYLNQAIKWSELTKRADCPEIKEHRTPEQWARESWQIAVDQGYLRGALKYGKDAETAAVLPEGYTKKLKSISEHQIALAGYRLADLIREMLNKP